MANLGRQIGRALVAATIVLGIGVTASGEEYPSRPIRVLVGSAPGGAADVGARLAAEALARSLRNPVYVELRGGAGGMNAVDAFLHAEPDGYTILLAAVGSFTIIPAAKQVSYDVERDFIPLGTVWRSAQVLAARPGMGVHTLADFVALARLHPAKMTYGSAGTGTVTHLTMKLLEQQAGIDLIHVPFRGTGAAMPALLGGQIDSLFVDAGVVAPRVNAGGVQALAVAASRRVPLLPDVPTMSEAGYPRVIGEIWFGLVASAKAPTDNVRRLQDALRAVHSDPAFRQALDGLHATAGEAGPEPLARLIASESAKWRVIVHAASIRLN